MTTSYYRIQQADRDVTELLDPANQVSHNWNDAADLRPCSTCGGSGYDDSDPAVIDDCTDCDGSGEVENVRQGVSAVGSLDDLYAYIRISGAWPYDCVIVEMSATRSDDIAEDAEIGEVLVHPTTILSVTDVTEDIIEQIYTEE